MLYTYDRKTHEELSIEHPNFVIKDKIYVLPALFVEQAVVEIFLTIKDNVVVESQHVPIRYDMHCSTRVILGFSNPCGRVDYNPKFIWNGKEWFLNTHGTFCFGEIEMNSPKETK